MKEEKKRGPKPGVRTELKGVYLSEKDLKRLDDIRRSLLHKEIVATSSSIVAAGLLFLRIMPDEARRMGLNFILNEREKEEMEKEDELRTGAFLEELYGRAVDLLKELTNK